MNQSQKAQNKPKHKKAKKQKQQQRPQTAKVVAVTEAKGRKTTNATATTGRQGVSIRHSEVLCPVYSNSSMLIDINPGLPAAFPWLSSAASCFRYYNINYLSFNYKPQVPTQTPGAIWMALDYETATEPPTLDVQSISQYEGATTTPAYRAGSVLKLDRRKIKRVAQLYVRNSPVPTGASVLDYDLARLYVHTTPGEGAAQAQIGWLEVSYTISFQVPIPNPGVGITIPYQVEGLTVANSNRLAQEVPLGAPIELSVGDLSWDDVLRVNKLVFKQDWTGYLTLARAMSNPYQAPPSTDRAITGIPPEGYDVIINDQGGIPLEDGSTITKQYYVSAPVVNTGPVAIWPTVRYLVKALRGAALTWAAKATLGATFTTQQQVDVMNFLFPAALAGTTTKFATSVEKAVRESSEIALLRQELELLKNHLRPHSASRHDADHQEIIGMITKQ